MRVDPQMCKSEKIQQFVAYKLKRGMFTPAFSSTFQSFHEPFLKKIVFLFLIFPLVATFFGLFPFLLPVSDPCAGASANWIHLFIIWPITLVTTPAFLLCWIFCVVDIDTKHWSVYRCIKVFALSSIPGLIVFSSMLSLLGFLIVYPVPFSSFLAAIVATTTNTVSITYILRYYPAWIDQNAQPITKKHVVVIIRILFLSQASVFFPLAYATLFRYIPKQYETLYAFVNPILKLTVKSTFLRTVEKIKPDLSIALLFFTECYWMMFLALMFTNITNVSTFAVIVSSDVILVMSTLYLLQLGKSATHQVDTSEIHSTRSFPSQWPANSSNLHESTGRLALSEGSPRAAVKPKSLSSRHTLAVLQSPIAHGDEATCNLESTSLHPSHKHKRRASVLEALSDLSIRSAIGVSKSSFLELVEIYPCSAPQSSGSHKSQTDDHKTSLANRDTTIVKEDSMKISNSVEGDVQKVLVIEEEEQERMTQTILSRMFATEFAELAVTLQFILILLVARFGINRDYYPLFTDPIFSSDQFHQSLVFLVCQFVVDIVMFAFISYYIRKKTCISFLDLGHFLTKKWLFLELIMANAACVSFIYGLGLQNTGNDLTFQFLWITKSFNETGIESRAFGLFCK